MEDFPYPYSPDNDTPQPPSSSEGIHAMREEDPEAFRALANQLWHMATSAEQDNYIQLSVDAFGSENPAAQDDFINERLVTNFINERRSTKGWEDRDRQDPPDSNAFGDDV